MSTASISNLDVKPIVKRTLWRDATRSFRKNKLAVTGLVIVAMFIFMAVFADVISPYHYNKSDLYQTLKLPNAAHWLGTDTIGRDILSRIIYGARTSLIVGFSVELFGFLIGLPLGALAGLRGGWVDFAISRLLEVMTAFPGFLFAIFLMSILGSSMSNVILAIGITSWIEVCRLTRGQIMSLREREFVVAARSYGSTDRHIVIKHLMPHALPPLIIMFALGVPNAIFAEAGLSFLGVGINDPIPSWGKMVSESLGYLNVYWHLGIFPTLTIALAMLSFNFLGDGLRDALDPTMYNQ
jgi:ABC-type dipeptide/oligopeptide/nickel transport system permease subunit